MPNNFGLFLTRGTTVMRLPVNPERLPVVREVAHGEYNVLGIGDIVQARIPGLRTVKISSYFPGRAFPGVEVFREPQEYINFINAAADAREPIIYTPVRYYEDGTPFMEGDIGMEMLVSSFTYEERGGETGDFYYDLALVEYRDYSPRTAQIRAASIDISPTAAATASPAVITTDPTRSTPAGQLTVGVQVKVNGSGYTTPNGDEAAITYFDNLAEVLRMVDGDRAAPVCIRTGNEGGVSWVAKDQVVMRN